MLTSGWSWLKSASLFHPPQRFVVTFKDVAGLNNNAPVNINGVRVGSVENIDLMGKGQVAVHLKISSEEITIPHGSAITIQTLGLVGAKYIEITLPDTSTKNDDIKPGETVVGQDPVRLELIANKIATKLSGFVNSLGSEDVGPSLADALKHSGEAVNNINSAAKKLNNNMDKMSVATESFTTTSNKIGAFADDIRGTGANAKQFFTNASSLAVDLKRTSGSLNRMLGNPNLSGDLRGTAELAKQTVDNLRGTVHELNDTLKDPQIRADVNAMLARLNTSTEHVRQSIERADKLAKDQKLRTDIVDATSNLRDSLNKLNNIVQDAGFKVDLKATMGKVKSAATSVDIAANRLNQAIDKPPFFLKLLIGKPKKSGEPQEIKVEAKNADGTKADVKIKKSDSKSGDKSGDDQKDKDGDQDQKTGVAGNAEVEIK